MNYIKIKNGVASREPVPGNLPESIEALADLSWTDPALGLQGCAWWPEVVIPAPYNPALQIPDGSETLTIDEDTKTVRSLQGLRNLTEAERDEWASRVLRQAYGFADKVTRAVCARLSDLSVFMYGYQHREEAALAYRDAGYKGEESGWVSSFADAAGMPYEKAVDLIILQGEQMRAAVYEIERLHMGKYLILRQSTVEQAQAICDQLVTAINTVPIT